jgi:hypothetical protein
MHKKLFISLALASLFVLGSCKKEYNIPQNYEYSKDSLAIFPDYKDIIIPPNIAPLNFRVDIQAKNILAEVCANKQTVVIPANEMNEIRFDEKVWKDLIKNEHGKGISIHIFAETEKGWMRYQDFRIDVAPEEIDRYVSYRLIEPGYELYRQMGLYQRDLECFEEKAIYENNRVHDLENNHCVNCHNYQNHSTEKMLFHVRGAHGGTIICNGQKIEKLDMKNDSILGPSVYPSWHPKMNSIAFSSNMTGQSFHILDQEKVEVVDGESDLVYFNVDKRSIKNVLKTKTDLENFPCWNPQGDKLYYCVAHVPQLDSLNQEESYLYFLNHYKEIKYNIMSLDFDSKKESFSNPQLVVNCSAEGKSASVPRISPDGKYLLFTKGDYGQFHIWHKSSDLWVKNLQDSTTYALSAANSKDVDSYHCWSSNGRWIVFSSRRDDGNFTRLYIAYFDKNGKAHKAFMLPQESPQDNILLLKSYNVPELTKDALKCDANSFKEVIYKQEAKRVDYKP